MLMLGTLRLTVDAIDTELLHQGEGRLGKCLSLDRIARDTCEGLAAFAAASDG